MIPFEANYALEVSDTEDAEKDISAGEENAAKDMNEGEYSDGSYINLLPKKANRGKINFIDDRMLACMDKCNLSTRDAMHLVSATVAAFINTMQNVNGTPSIKMEDLILNRTTLHSMRRDYRRRQAQEIINGFNVMVLLNMFIRFWILDLSFYLFVDSRRFSPSLGWQAVCRNPRHRKER